MLLLVLLLLLPAAPAAGEDDAGDYTWRLGLKEGLQVRGLSCLRIHPRADGILWAHVHGLGPARSEDGGRTWLPRLEGIDEDDRPGPLSQVRISLDPREPAVMYLVVDGRIYRSEDAGDTWKSITSGALASLSWDKLTSTHLGWEVRVDPKKGNHLLIGTRNDGRHNGGLFESTNGGKSWERIAGTVLPKSNLGSDTFLVRSDPRTDKVITVAGRTAVWYSDDRGRTFERRHPGGEGLHDIRDLSEVSGRLLFLGDVRGVWRSRDAGKSWDKKPLHAGSVLDVHVDPHSRKRVYAVFHERGVEHSEDSRHSKWFGVRGANEPADADVPSGYRDAEPREIYVHPRDRKRVYLASPVTGLHVSGDEGQTFAPVEVPTGHDPEAPTKVLPQVTAAMAFVAAHPEPGGSHLALSREGVVYRSENRGESWARAGRLGEFPSALLAEPAPQTWLAAGRTLMRSQDDGATWEVIFPPAEARDGPGPEARIVAVHHGAAAQGKPGLLRVLYDRGGVVYTSEDGGATWKAAKAPKAIASSDSTWAANLAVDPADPQHLVMSARSTRVSWSARDEDGGIFESFDGGASWNDITGNLAPGKRDKPEVRRAKSGWNQARFLALDPSSRLILYGADEQGFLARPWADEKGKPVAKDTPWVRVDPVGMKGPTILTALHTETPDRTDTRIVTQIEPADGAAACFEITGRTLAALHAFASAESPEGERPAWTTLPSPGEGEVLGALSADPQLPGRLLAADRDGEHGILVFEIPGSKPEAPAKDEPKKDDGKKDEPKKDGDGAAVPAVRPPEGMRAFTAGQDKLVRVWGVDTGSAGARITGHENAVTCIALAPDETTVLTGSEDRTVRLWDAANGKPLASLPVEGIPRGVVVDEDSTYAYVALGGAGGLVQVDLAKRTLRSFSGHKGEVLSVAVSEDVNRAYSGGADNVVLVWDAAKGTEVNAMVVGAAVQALAVSRDGMRVFAAGADGSLAAFDAAGKPAGRLASLPAPATALAVAPDGATLYAATKDGVLEVATADMSARMMHAAPEAGVLGCLGISADGVWIAAGDAQGGLWMWHRHSAKAHGDRVQGHEGPLRGICLTREETELAAPPPAAGDGAKPPEDAPQPVPDGPGDDAGKGDGAGKGDAPKAAPEGGTPGK